MKPPVFPLDRVLIHNGAYNESGNCPNCGSSAIRKPWLFGKRYCINEQCKFNKKPINKKS